MVLMARTRRCQHMINSSMLFHVDILIMESTNSVAPFVTSSGSPILKMGKKKMNDFIDVIDMRINTRNALVKCNARNRKLDESVNKTNRDRNASVAVPFSICRSSNRTVIYLPSFLHWHLNVQIIGRAGGWNGRVRLPMEFQCFVLCLHPKSDSSKHKPMTQYTF